MYRRNYTKNKNNQIFNTINSLNTLVSSISGLINSNFIMAFWVVQL